MIKLANLMPDRLDFLAWNPVRVPHGNPRLRTMFAVIGVLLALPMFAASMTDPRIFVGGECTCVRVQTEGGWCPKCATGFVAGIAVKSQLLFEAIDAHGHDIDPKSLFCPTCKSALEADGYCEPCRIGFIRSKAYLSRLSYCLGRGTTGRTDEIKCADCAKHSHRFGWCEPCKVGMLGNIALSDRRLFDDGAREMERLFASLDLLKSCETCAVANFTNGKCGTCKVAYRAGQRFPTSPKNDRE